MDRQDMLRVIGEGYAARVRGDVEGVLDVFTSDAQFKLNAVPQKAPVSLRTEGTNALRQAMTQLVQTFEFQKLDIIDAVVEGSKAAIRIRIMVRSKQTGNIAETESPRPCRISRRQDRVLYAILRYGGCGATADADGSV